MLLCVLFCIILFTFSIIHFQGKSAYLLVTNRHEIRRIDPVKREYTQVVSTQKNAVALDLDVANNRIFWSDRFHRKIYRYVAYGAFPPEGAGRFSPVRVAFPLPKSGSDPD